MIKARAVFPICVFLFLFQSISVNAAEADVFGSRIFKFQKKFAMKGNTLAEYKLGTFYEFGVSVEPNTEQAVIWYKKSAKKKHVPAINRLTYLEIRKSGYIESKYGDWFKKLKAQVETGESNSRIVLGQMYRYGIKVNKDLEKAVELLEQASSLGHTEVDLEIDSIKQEIAKSKKAIVTKKKSSKKSARKKVSKKKVSKKKTTSKKTASKKSIKKKEETSASKKIKAKQVKNTDKKSKEEKRRKYEAALRKIHQESLILNEQQEWAEGEEEVE